MIEPGVRYLPHVPLPAPHHHHHHHSLHHNHHDDLHHHHLSLEAAVDLTKKSAAEDWRPRSPHDAADGCDDDGGGGGEDNDSDSDTPLDMSVTSRLTPVFPGFQRDLSSPARSDRSAAGGEPHLQVRLTGLYSPGGVREWSAERGGSDVDKGQSLI
jgi:hypothetical protein